MLNLSQVEADGSAVRLLNLFFLLESVLTAALGALFGLAAAILDRAALGAFPFRHDRSPGWGSVSSGQVILL